MYLISQIRNNCIKNVIVNVFLRINGVQHVTIEQQIQLQSSVQIMPNAFGVIAVIKGV